MEFLTIDKRMAVRGNIQFNNESVFGLEVNTLVESIGDGRETGCYRTDLFSVPFKYVGSFVHDSIKYFAFKVPLSLLPEDNMDHFLLYESTGLELLSRTKSYVRFFTPQFGIIK